MKLVFEIKPISKDNVKTQNKYGNYFLPKKYKCFETDIQKQFIVQAPGFKPMMKEVCMTLRFFFIDRRSCDLGNAPKSILDALEGFLYINDRQICEMHCFRNFDKENPRIELMAEEV